MLHERCVSMFHVLWAEKQMLISAPIEGDFYSGHTTCCFVQRQLSLIQLAFNHATRMSSILFNKHDTFGAFF